MSEEAVTAWLDPLRLVVEPAGEVGWARLAAMGTELDRLLAAHPIGADLPPGIERSRRLQLIRREMARRCPLDTSGQAPLLQLLAQFLCGYRDIDLRDTLGLGHGQLIARHARPKARQQWIRRLSEGELAGIAITEPNGGSRPAATRTRAVPGPDGMWLITGHKTWISRLTEAAVFVVFFRDPVGCLAAAAIDATTPGLHRQFVAPTGLAGWAWGVLELDAVPVRPDEDVLRGDGMAILRQHFAGYRPLVTATALGGAAAVFDTVTHQLNLRQVTGELPRLRDSALVTLGRTHARLTTALLGTVAAARLADSGFSRAEQWSCVMKAHGIDTAFDAVGELALLVGAAAYRADSSIAKTFRDLGGLRYADGIHDSLYRAAGKHHVAPTPSGASDTGVQPRGVFMSA